MMDAAATIQPFGFDRVFFHKVDTPVAPPQLPDEPSFEALQEQVEDLQALVERMKAEHAAELARARADGFEAGAAQARTERGEALLAATDALYASLDLVECRFDEAAQRMVGEAGAVAFHAAEMLAGHAIDEAPARAIDEALGRALDQVVRGTALVVRANPEMCEDIAALIEAREGRAGRALSITVVSDEEVAPGDARIDWNAGGLDVDAQARRAAVLAELDGVLRPATQRGMPDGRVPREA
ncbi:FliH/SctL family protein [Novosphingobium sp. HII-3]|uniref:FliH/SctL family protein n=2 Tax=Novosphingobium TaxID=165696 RepID=UPI000CDA5A91|nr:FliH/SctL family protein [Novosphingobium sp. HII-3]